MLQTIRNLFTGWIAVIFIVLLIIPFAFWGVDSYFGSATNIDAAEVNGVEVSLAEYQQSYQNIRQQMQGINPALAEQNEFIRQQTLDKLVDRILLLGVKDELGFRVSNEQVRSAIYSIPAFQNPEGFDSVAYQNFLLSSGYTPAQFEAELREDMSLEQLQAGLIQTTIVTPGEARQIAALQGQTRNIQYATVSFGAFEDQIQVTDSDIQAYYDENSNDFMTPEQVRVAYIQLSIDSIADEVATDEDTLRAYFDNFRDNYSITERRKVRQILVYAEDDANREQAGEVARQIYDLVTSSDGGFDSVQDQFDSEEITVEVSDFGFLNQGVLDPEVDEVAFSLEPGVISDPIMTEYGYQLVIVDEITGGDRPDYEQVRGEVETDYRREQAQKVFFEMYDELSVLTYEHPESLEMASESLGLPVQESGTLSRLGAEDPVLNNQKVLTTAFSEDVLTNGNNSEIIELDTDNVLVLRVREHQQEQVQPLDQVQEVIRQRLRFEKGSALTRARGEEIISSLQQGSTPAAVEEQYNIAWTSREAVPRDSSDLDRQILETVFRSGKPSGGGPMVEGVSLTSGDYTVVIVDSINEVDPASLSAEQVELYQRRIMQNRASRAWSNLLQDLRSTADIQVYEDNL